MDLLVTPHGRIAVCDPQGAASMADKTAPLAVSFAQGRAEGLVTLADRPPTAGDGGGLRFFTGFAGSFMRYLCAHAECEPLNVPLAGFDAARLAAAAPPMVGGEYVTDALLQELAREMLDLLVARMAREGLGVRAYLARRMPGWESVGLLHFHLAENPQSQEYPFAFLATYSVRVADKARLQHRPLAAALSDSLGQHSSGALAARLMAPLHQASLVSSFVQRFLANQGLLRQLQLTPREAFEFVSQIESIEQSGIVCRVPASWRQGRPARARLLATVGDNAARSPAGFGSMMDFRLSLALGDEALSEQAARELLASDEGLVLVRGQWVEVDSARLKDLMARMQAAMGVVHGRGVSFGEAMRMIHGLVMPGAGGASGARDAELIRVAAGAGLKESLAALESAASGAHDEAAQAALESELSARLRPYQREGVFWLLRLWQLGQGGCLADDMGLGKTLQVIALLVIVRKLGLGGVLPPSLLVVPASLLFNWQAELRRFAPSLQFTVCHPSGGGSVCGASLRGDLVITTYGMLVRSPPLWDIPWNIVIADEAQNIKNAHTRAAQCLRGLGARARFALTGTPVENSINDLWAIFAFACPGLLGPQVEFGAAMERLAGGSEGFLPLRKVIAPYLLRRRKNDRSVINDLPEKIEVRTACYLTRQQAQLYQKQVAALARDLKGVTDDKKRGGLVLAGLLKLKQICNHPSQAIGDAQYLPALSGKFARLGELAAKIAARQEKLLVFTQFREITDILAHYLFGVFGRAGLVLHGGVSVEDRRCLVEHFQKEDGPPFFVLSLKAGGAGLNLTRAAHVVHFDRWWNPAVENQATDRAFRIGQTQNVMVHKFVCPGTIEDKVDRMLLAKGDLASDLVEDLPRLALGRLGDAELMQLMALDPGAELGAEEKTHEGEPEPRAELLTETAVDA